MPTLIVFRTTHGFTEKAVQLLMTGMKDDTTVVNLLGDTNPEISGYDRIIIGGLDPYGRDTEGDPEFLHPKPANIVN